jgi:hypothetical protein
VEEHERRTVAVDRTEQVGAVDRDAFEHGLR